MFQELAERFVAAIEQIPAALDRNTDALSKALHFRQQLAGDATPAPKEEESAPAAETPAPAAKKVVVKKTQPAAAAEKKPETPEVPYEEIADLIKSTYDKADKVDPSQVLRRSTKDAWFEVMKGYGVDTKAGGTGRDIPADKRGEAMEKFKAKVEELFAAATQEEDNDGV